MKIYVIVKGFMGRPVSATRTPHMLGLLLAKLTIESPGEHFTVIEVPYADLEPA